jgi:hypothetical protein
MSSVGAAPRAAVAVSDARAAASRINGARSRGPKTPAGKARAAQNAIKHGMRALKYVVLPDESAAEFHEFEEAMVDELAPVGAVQAVLARRVAVAAWRLARADRMEVELFEERRWEDAGVGMALIRDGNGTRSFETLMRYRSAAMAEFMRALRTLKALQAEAALAEPHVAAPAPGRARSSRPAARRANAGRPRPNKPEPRPGSPSERGPEYMLPNPSGPGRTRHEPAAPWMPNEPEPALALPPAPALPVAHGDRAAGRATVCKLTRSAAGGVDAVIERQDIDGLLAELRARAGSTSF